MPNVVEVEFFQIGEGNITSFFAFMTRRRERAADSRIVRRRDQDLGSGIKTVVRFDDLGNRLTNHALQMEASRALEHALFKRLVDETLWWKRKLLDMRCRRLNRQIMRMNERGHRLAIEQFKKAAASETEIAIQRRGWSFSLVRDNERSTLYEIVERSKGVWYFTYEPEDILSTRRMLVAACSI